MFFLFQFVVWEFQIKDFTFKFIYFLVHHVFDFIFYFLYCGITGLDDHDKDENIEESIKTVHKFLTKTIKMELKESDINIAHRLGPFRPRQNRPVIVYCFCVCTVLNHFSPGSIGWAHPLNHPCDLLVAKCDFSLCHFPVSVCRLN
jgi:hypothetical protein